VQCGVPRLRCRHPRGRGAARQSPRRLTTVCVPCAAQVLRAPGGWTAGGCKGKVWYYTSTGALRAGPDSIADSGIKFGEGDVILLDLDVRARELRIARGAGSSEPGRVGFSSRPQPLAARRPGAEAGAPRQGYAFECIPAIPLEAPGAEDVFASTVCVAVTMFFEGACCELVPLEPPEGCELPDHTASSAVWEGRESWANKIWPLFPPFTLASASHGDVAPAGGPPSVPRLSLTGVGDVSGGLGLNKGGASSGREPVSAGREGPASGGRDWSGSDRDGSSSDRSGDRRLPSPHPAGPLSSRSGGTIASNSPGRNVASGADSRGPLGLGGPRPSPRLAGGGLGGGKTPRSLSIAGQSPQITPRNQNPPSSPPRRAASPRGTSPRMSERTAFMSPRLPSPKTTPRGSLSIMSSSSPRKPLEALPATLTLQQHQKMESMLNRIETLEAMVTRTLAENRRLESQLVSSRRANANGDACEGGGRDDAAAIAEGDTLARAAMESDGKPPLSPTTPRVPARHTTCESEPGNSTAATRASRGIKVRDNSSGAKCERPSESVEPGEPGANVALRASGHDSNAVAAASEPYPPADHSQTFATNAAGRDADAPGQSGPAVDRNPFRLSDVWEVNPEEVSRTRCIGRGACGTVWEGEWRRAKVAIKDLDRAPGAQRAGQAAGAVLMDHDREMLAAFRGEVAQLACLRHPNVLAFFGAVSRGDKV
jgi:hypothetical protein